MHRDLERDSDFINQNCEMTATTSISLEGILAFLNSMTLSAQNKRWLGEHLIAQAVKEESATPEPLARKRKVIRRYENAPSDQELEARFAGMQMPEIPSDPEWSQVINANSGKMIKSIEKWL